MKVSIKQRKPNKKGIITMYLEIYMGYTKDHIGKIKHKREYIKLDTYLYHKPKTTIQKAQNKEMLKIAEAVKAKYTIEIKNNEHGFKNSDKGNTYLLEYYQYLTDKKRETYTNKTYKVWISAFNHLKAYCKNKNTKLNQVDPEFVSGYVSYLLNDARTNSNKKLSQNSASVYFKKFKACMNQAERSNLISYNPCKAVKGIKEIQPKREILTIEELTILDRTECKYPLLKRAFLFSCFTGLRISDLKQLQWKQVKDTTDGCRISYRQQKTKGFEYQDISPQARDYLGERKNNNELVFPKLSNETYYNNFLQKWIDQAGIDKKISFHNSRHTFGCLLLAYETDVYTISKLMGHKKIQTTQIYAKIMDKTKKDAVYRIPNIKQQ